MTRKIRFIVLFVLSMVALQQMLAVVNKSVPTVKAQINLIKTENIDPSVMFYTESKQVLKAEKEVRKSLNQ